MPKTKKFWHYFLSGFTTSHVWRKKTPLSNQEQGWHSGQSTRLPPMWPAFDSQTQRHMWVEFVGSLLCSERFFSGYSGFPLFSKTNMIWYVLILFYFICARPHKLFSFKGYRVKKKFDYYYYYYYLFYYYCKIIFQNWLSSPNIFVKTKDLDWCLCM